MDEDTDEVQYWEGKTKILKSETKKKGISIDKSVDMQLSLS